MSTTYISSATQAKLLKVAALEQCHPKEVFDKLLDLYGDVYPDAFTPSEKTNARLAELMRRAPDRFEMLKSSALRNAPGIPLCELEVKAKRQGSDETRYFGVSTNSYGRHIVNVAVPLILRPLIGGIVYVGYPAFEDKLRAARLAEATRRELKALKKQLDDATSIE